MEAAKQADVEAMRQHHSRGEITAFAAAVFDVIGFAVLVERVSFNEHIIDAEVRARSKYDIPRRKENIVIKFDGYFGEAGKFDEDLFSRMHDFGGIYAHRLSYFDQDKFEVVHETSWSFSEKAVDARVQDFLAKGVKAAKASRLFKFEGAFTLIPSPAADL
jgi:hypothetical protein